MATKKQLISIIIINPLVLHFFAYVDNASQWKKDVLSIEGVEDVSVTKNLKSRMSVRVDPRLRSL